MVYCSRITLSVSLFMDEFFFPQKNGDFFLFFVKSQLYPIILLTCFMGKFNQIQENQQGLKQYHTRRMHYARDCIFYRATTVTSLFHDIRVTQNSKCQPHQLVDWVMGKLTSFNVHVPTFQVLTRSLPFLQPCTIDTITTQPFPVDDDR